MLRRLFITSFFSLFLLVFTPAWGGFSLHGSTNIDTFDHDLDGMHLALESLNADWQMSPNAESLLTIHRLRAKRLVITMKDHQGQADNGLPNEITLPFPIKVNQSEIEEVVVVKQDEIYTLTHVTFSFSGTAKSLTLNLAHAQTPWGNVQADIALATTKPFAISGNVHLNQAKHYLPYDVAAQLSGNLETLRIDSESALTRIDNQIALVRVQASNLKVAKVLTHISLGLTGDRSVKLTTSIHALRPECLGDFPQALLNIDLNVEGNLLPQPDLYAVLTSRDSQWQNQAISSRAEMLIQNTHIRDINLDVKLLDSQFSANGDLNQQGSMLKWALTTPSLSAFDPHYAGKLSMDGTIEGAFEALALRMNLKAENVKFGDFLTSKQLTGQAVLMAGQEGKLDAKVNAGLLQVGSHPVVDGIITIAGTRDQHDINVNAHNQDLTFDTHLRGGLTDWVHWQGNIEQLSHQEKTKIMLVAPVPLYISANAVSLQNANFAIGHGKAIVEKLQFDDEKWESKGQLKSFALADVPSTLFTFAQPLNSDLIISGDWDIAAKDAVDGRLHFWRESGDVTLLSPAKQPLVLGLNAFTIKALFDQNRTTLDIKVAGRQLGGVDVQLTTAISHTGAGFALMKNAPLKLSSRADLNTLAWLPLPISWSDAEIEGKVAWNVRGDGSLDSPNLSGEVEAKSLKLSILSQGLALTDGALLGRFEKERLMIKEAKWKGGDGFLTTHGSIGLSAKKPEVSLDWQAEQFTALSRTDLLLIVSGRGKTVITEDLLTISGDFTANQGFIQLAEDSAPKLDDDVIILGQASDKPDAALRVLLGGLRVNLGDDFTIRGQGIDAQLTGALTLTGLSQYQPHTDGSIQIKRGTYLAYGQVLVVQEGRFTFSGPLDNPGIQLRAMRNSTPVNAGIQITGTAYSPVTKLISDPTVPDSEKLSWLVLGHGMDQAGGNEFAMLSLAAGAILTQGQSVPLQTQLARAAGLDELSFSGGNTESSALTLGKRLSSKLYLSYQKSINGLLDIARLTFNMTPRWSLRAESGAESAVDVLYTFSFK